MADSGVPQGGMYPSRAELGALPFNNAGALFVDRRKLYGKQAGRIYNDALTEQDIQNGYTAAGLYYAPDQYEYGTATDEDIANAVNGARPGFVEWDVPTSSTNYQRPRTVAAGYTPNPSDPTNGTMTVVFRDGTFYNYYEVSPTEWEAFHASYSKGKPWLNVKNSQQASDGLFIGKPRGIADDISTVSPEIREALYRVARTQQQKASPKPGRSYQRPGYIAPGVGRVPIRNAQGRSPSAYKGGKNTTINGRNNATANRQRKAS